MNLLLPALLQCLPHTEVPFESVHGLIVIEIQINHSKRVKAIVDTGAGTTCLDSALVEKLHLDLGESVDANGSIGTHASHWVKGARVSGLGAEAGLSAISLDLKPIANMIDSPLDVILGYDYLAKRSFEVDPVAKKLTFFEGAYPRSIEGSLAIPFTVRDGRPHMRAKIKKPNGEIVTADVVFDTGKNGSISVGGKTARKGKLAELKGRVGLRGGIGGLATTTFADVQSVQLGTWTIPDVSVEIPPIKSKSDSSEGLVGMALLKGSRYVVDYVSRHVYVWLH